MKALDHADRRCGLVLVDGRPGVASGVAGDVGYDGHETSNFVMVGWVKYTIDSPGLEPNS